jgi:hypothetical protein
VPYNKHAFNAMKNVRLVTGNPNLNVFLAFLFIYFKISLVNKNVKKIHILIKFQKNVKFALKIALDVMSILNFLV